MKSISDKLRERNFMKLRNRIEEEQIKRSVQGRQMGNLYFYI
jgi:hypothetical protein